MEKKNAPKYYDENHRRAAYKYKSKNTQNICISLSKIYDAELIEIYRSIPDKAGWFKGCLMEYKEKCQK